MRGEAVGELFIGGPRLAFAGFVMLAADAARRLCGRRTRALTAAATGVITAHVCCVWGLRFGWSLTAMLNKGVAAFVLFHAAYATIVAAVYCLRHC